MGSSSSVIRTRINTKDIVYIAPNKVVLNEEDKEPNSLFFDDDIKDKCHELFMNPDLVAFNVCLYQNIIVVITNPKTHKTYYSSKVSPTTFGWYLN